MVNIEISEKEIQISLYILWTIILIYIILTIIRKYKSNTKNNQSTDKLIKNVFTLDNIISETALTYEENSCVLNQEICETESNNTNCDNLFEIPMCLNRNNIDYYEQFRQKLLNKELYTQQHKLNIKQQSAINKKCNLKCPRPNIRSLLLRCYNKK